VVATRWASHPSQYKRSVLRKRYRQRKQNITQIFSQKNSSSSKYLKIINLNGVVKEDDSTLEMMGMEVVRY
jgi:hypothetical protein